jgi:hypothetical protein
MDFDLAHVAHVEQAGGGSNGRVLFEDSRVLQRHPPAAKIDHFGAHSDVRGVQASGFERDDGHL